MPIARILRLELLGFLYVLVAVIAYQMLTRRINVSGLLQQKDGGGGASPERIQLLLATMAAGANYLVEVGKSTNGNLPDISNTWLYLMGGSSSIYVLRKAWSTFASKNKLGGLL